MKLLLIGLLSFGLVACNGGEEGESSQGAVYGLDFDYDGTHPEEIGVSPTGKLEPFIIDMNDMVTHCGLKFFKSADTGDVFEAVEINGNWHAQQFGQYWEYDKSMGGFQTVGYEDGKRVYVGKYVVISSYPSLSNYFYWTRVNLQDRPEMDNCMVIVDEENQDVMSVDLTTEEMTSIF